MIILYTGPSSASSRRAKDWLIAHNIQFIERSLSKSHINAKEIETILIHTESGLNSILSIRSKWYSQFSVNMENLSLKEAIQKLCEHPELIKRPIIMDDHKIQIGFNTVEMRKFIPRNERKQELENKLRQFIDKDELPGKLFI